MRVHRETLGTMRQTIADLTRTLSHTETAASLAITTKPDHRETVRDMSDRSSRYIVSAYGLTRASGGYVIVRFICRGQWDSVSFHLFDDWSVRLAPEFRSVAQRISDKRYDLLRPADGSPVGTRYTMGDSK